MNCVLQSRRHQEELLLETQFLSCFRLIVWIEDARDILGVAPLFDRLQVVTAVELVNVEVTCRLCGPKAQGVDYAILVTDDWKIVGHCLDFARLRPVALDAPPRSGVVNDSTTEMHAKGPLRPRHFPRVAATQPVVWRLDLSAFHDILAENPEFIANAVTHAGNSQGRHRIDEARSQTSEATVTEAGVD